jgi:hypothetical protein
LGSRNGTKLDGMRVTEKEKLSALHVITFAGNFDFIFQLVDEVNQKPKKGNHAGGAARQAIDNMTPRNGVPQPLAVGEFWETPVSLANDKTTGQILTGAVASAAAQMKSPENGKTIIGEAIMPFPTPLWTEEKSKSAGEKTRQKRPAFQLKIETAGKGTKIFQLKDGDNLIGRSSECAICIDDPSISRQHAVLTVRSGKVVIKDLKSRNHTFVDKTMITSEVEIRHETTLRFGRVEAELRREA